MRPMAQIKKEKEKISSQSLWGSSIGCRFCFLETELMSMFKNQTFANEIIVDKSCTAVQK